MLNKKAAVKKAAQKKTTIIKIAEKVGEIAGKIANEKDHLVEMASGAIQSVKTSIDNLTSKKKVVSKKINKAEVKKVAKKTVKPIAKKVAKAATSKKPATIKKAVKKVAKKGIKKAAKKSFG